jgi:hypothetical protein
MPPPDVFAKMLIAHPLVQLAMCLAGVGSFWATIRSMRKELRSSARSLDSVLARQAKLLVGSVLMGLLGALLLLVSARAIPMSLALTLIGVAACFCTLFALYFMACGAPRSVGRWLLK